MIFPTLLLYAVYIILPIGISAYYSLTKFTGIGAPQFIGLANYRELAADPLLLTALKNSFIVLAVSLAILLLFSFLISLLLSKGIKGSGVCKALIFSPAIIAPIIVGMLWIFIFDPKIGFINMLFQNIGLENLKVEWIGGKIFSPYSIGIVFVWQQIGFIATIFIAGLKMVPTEVYEASNIDGANLLQQTIYVTIPLIKDTIVINAILIITGSLKVFEIVLQLTNGGPNHLSEVLVTYTYQTTFMQGRYGYGMSMAVVTFFITMLLSAAISIFNRNSENS